jgi:tRNA-splicing ligase RtcB
MTSKRKESALRRVDGARVTFENEYGVPVTVLARHDVVIEPEGLEQLLEFLSLQDTLARVAEEERAGRIPPFWGESPGRIEQVVITPDFHRGSGIPVGTVVDARGFVVPRAIGNDVCCGMRLLVTDARRDELAPHLHALERRLRAIFFQGQRDIPMSPRQREALLREGLWGLHETIKDNQGTGLWKYYDPAAQADDLERAHFQGVLPAGDVFAFERFIQASGASDGRDPQIGSVGGGNHFVEIQTVEEILDGSRAHAWGLARDAVAVMAHSGSVGIGHMVGGHFCARAHEVYPRGVPHPKHGFYVLPTAGPIAREALHYLDAMRNAANFAFGNRLCLGLMAVRAMSEVLGRRVSSRLVYDAPHNLIWEQETGAQQFLHRKGATPAQGPDGMSGPFACTGHPVIIPGSMGASSFVLAGEGNRDALESACHGAGRSLTRGRSAHVDDEVFEKSAGKLRVVTPIDPDSPQIRSRRDILQKYRQRLKEEAPYAYKPITPVVQTMEDAAVARRVARLWPIMTVKG